MSAALRLSEPAMPVAPPQPASRARSLLRFITCGSVDDGKSTLIGRILYESGAVFDDHLETLAGDSARFGTAGKALDFALLVDGLAAEREQGITIDVAYRYFSTPRRHFIVADTPGHEQFTRNMATGASTADLAILLVDARKGLLPQTRRHSFIVSMMGVRHIVVAINKMDLVGFDEATFRRIEAEYHAAVATLGFDSITCIPVVARDGDNLTAHSLRMPWFRGTPLLPLLETMDASPRQAIDAAFALPAQWVNRPDADFRGVSGTIASGRISPGDAVQALPSGRTSRVSRIVTADGDLAEAVAGQAVTLVLADEIDLARGDVLVSGPGARVEARPRVLQTLAARLIITADRQVAVGDEFALKLGTAMATARVTEIRAAVDVEQFRDVPAEMLALNAIGTVVLRLDRGVVVQPFRASTWLGGFLLIDRQSHETAAFGFIEAEAAATPAGPARGEGRVIRWIGVAGSARRREWLGQLSWRLASAGLTGALVALFTASPGWAVLAAGLDLALRPLARAGHDALWKRHDERRLAGLSTDGGGI